MIAPPNDSPPPMRKRVRMHRQDRVKTFEIHDETGHLWAVSYADFLMVLLSFFIIFFSVDQKKSSLLQRLKISGTQELRDAQGNTPRDTASIGGMGNQVVDPALSPSLKSLKDKLSTKYLVRTVDSEKIIVALPDDIFANRSVKLNLVGQAAVLKILQELQPFQQQIELTFVGHTDSRLLTGSQSYLQDNYDLSVLRATAGLRLALRLGYSPQNISAQGTADQIRNNRSLSLVVFNKGNGL